MKKEKYKPKGLELFRKQRYLFYSFLTIFILSLPFIKINNNHIFLLSFEKQELHLIGASFNVQELYLLPFLLIILFVGIFFMTTLGGRVWCGWGCPQTLFRVIYRDFLQTTVFKLRRRIDNKQQKIKLDSISKIARYFACIVIFAILAIIASANFLFFFVPPEDFLRYILSPSEHRILYSFWMITAIFMIADICFIAENFCIYICPYARVQSVLFDNDTVMPIYDTHRGGIVYQPNGKKNMFQGGGNECIDCLGCVRVCPTHIDIRKGVQLECINCLECVDACTKTMGNLGKPSLINWSSPNAIDKRTKINFFRLKTIGYIVVLSIIFTTLLFIASTKEGMLVNINRSSELYDIRSSGAVDNSYRILLENTDSKAHIFNLEIEGELRNDFDFIRPKNLDISIKGGGSDIVVVVLRAKGNKEFLRDTKVPIKIKAFAKDNKDKIFAIRETLFIYPAKTRILQKMQKKG